MKEKNKVLQLQIRVSSQEKANILRMAKKANMGMSEWVLNKIFPKRKVWFQQLVKELTSSNSKSYVLAEIHDLLKNAAKEEFEQIVSELPEAKLSLYWENYIAAMVEYAAYQKGVKPPSWTAEIVPLKEPVFGSELKNLRLYLLTHSPVAFRCRNIFIDSTIGARV